jgi:hypothetical protein
VIPSPPTLHVVGTEMVVGSFALSGACFLLALLGSLKIWRFHLIQKKVDTIAHGALLFGLLATPLAILSGIQSSPGDGIQSTILATKMLLAMSGVGLALAILVVRMKQGIDLWNQTFASVAHAMFGMMAVGMMLLTASLGGRFSRGESLLDFAHLPYDTLFLASGWFSAVILLIGLANIVMYIRRGSAIEH